LKLGRSFATFSRDSNYIIVVSNDKALCIYDTYPSEMPISHMTRLLNTGGTLPGLERVTFQSYLTCALFFPFKTNGGNSLASNGALIVVADVNGSVKVYENFSNPPDALKNGLTVAY
jgi:WD40 repeat protein